MTFDLNAIIETDTIMIGAIGGHTGQDQGVGKVDQGEIDLDQEVEKGDQGELDQEVRRGDQGEVDQEVKKGDQGEANQDQGARKGDQREVNQDQEVYLGLKSNQEVKEKADPGHKIDCLERERRN